MVTIGFLLFEIIQFGTRSTTPVAGKLWLSNQAGIV